jgi:hypothetical protein
MGAHGHPSRLDMARAHGVKRPDGAWRGSATLAGAQCVHGGLLAGASTLDHCGRRADASEAKPPVSDAGVSEPQVAARDARHLGVGGAERVIALL